MTLRVIFRFDSGNAIGMGHLKRCLTLAEALQHKGAEIMFLCQPQTRDALKHYWPSADVMIVESGISESKDATQCQTLLSRLTTKPDWLIVDHYKLGKNWETAMRHYSHKLMAIDDLERDHDCDLLLDANFSLDGEARYQNNVSSKCIKLLGPGYALLRSSFKKALASRQPSDRLRIFLCFGGSDPHQTTRFAVEILDKCLPDHVAMDVVLGYSYADKPALEKICASHPNWRLWSDHPHPEYLMAQADLAIGAGGTMTWERCAIGLPSIVISIADNQRESCEAMAARGLMHYLGDYGHVTADALRDAVITLIDDAKVREAMASAGRMLVNISGAESVARKIQHDSNS